MAGGIGTGLYVHGDCISCGFSSFEEVDTPERDPHTPKIAMWYEVKRAKVVLSQSHREREPDCRLKTFFSFREGTPYREDLRGIAQAAEIAAGLINR
jgi:hypothetical protein